MPLALQAFWGANNATPALSRPPTCSDLLPPVQRVCFQFARLGWSQHEVQSRAVRLLSLKPLKWCSLTCKGSWLGVVSKPGLPTAEDSAGPVMLVT